jgi:hypothetical protein
MLLLGMFTGGAAWNDRLALVNGVREGSRYGATLPVASAPCLPAVNDLDCWLRQVARITIQASEGQLDADAAGRSICVAYVSPFTTPVDETRKITITGTQTADDGTISSGSCYADSRPASERRVQVTASVPFEIQFVVGSVERTTTSRSVTKFEAGT